MQSCPLWGGGGWGADEWERRSRRRKGLGAWYFAVRFSASARCRWCCAFDVQVGKCLENKPGETLPDKCWGREPWGRGLEQGGAMAQPPNAASQGSRKALVPARAGGSPQGSRSRTSCPQEGGGGAWGQAGFMTLAGRKRRRSVTLEGQLVVLGGLLGKGQ